MVSLYNQVFYRLKRFQTMQRMGNGFARAAAVRSSQLLEATCPTTWEFSGLSQNGEDGIIDYLVQHLADSNRYFVEIGASDGTENNSSWLAVARRWRGLMVEGNAAKADYCRFVMGGLAVGVEIFCSFVTLDNLKQLRERIYSPEPDLLSLDIDGVDYYIAEALLRDGLRPKIFVVEYNSCFGPESAVTIPYRPDFNFRTAHPTQLYYGVSIAAWRHLLERYGYKFLTVESNGVNAFFVRPECFPSSMLEGLRPMTFAENFYQLTRHRCAWEGQFALIEGMPLSKPGDQEGRRTA